MLVIGERSRIVSYEKKITIRCNTSEETSAVCAFMEKTHPEFQTQCEGLLVTVAVHSTNAREHQEMFNSLLSELKGFASGYLWSSKGKTGETDQ